MYKKRILTGDRPTGRLHLGHYVGSLKNRVKLQEEYDCYFIIADLHTLTTQPEKTDELKENIHQLVLDYLSVGIDPTKATIFVQSQVPQISELAIIFGNLVSVPRLERVPTLKDVMRDANIKIPSFGLLGYPVLQAADILSVRADLVPVGRDQASHIEVTREIAREFNRLYPIGALRSSRQFGESSNTSAPAELGVRSRRRGTLGKISPHAEAPRASTDGAVFPIPEALIPGDLGTLPGTDGKAKMSKSAGNVINLSDDSETVKKKVMGMYTDPKRIHGDEAGDTQSNPVFVYLRVFGSENHESRIKEFENKYKKGAVGDVEVKEFLFEVLEEFLQPLRILRRKYEGQPELIEKILKEGTQKTTKEAQKTLNEVKGVMKLIYF